MMIKKIPKSNEGFTIIELMVSMSVFSISLLIVMGSILTVLDANRKSQSMRAVMDNLNAALEGMTRDIRFGSVYHCGSAGTFTEPQDCGADSTLYLQLSSQSGLQYAAYRFNDSLKRIEKLPENGSIFYPVTSPDVFIDDLKFRVSGSGSYTGNGDPTQAKVIITIKGHAGLSNKPNLQTYFNLETMVSQRKLDL